MKDLRLAWIICAHLKSNAMVLVAGGRAVGMGSGQQTRVDATDIACSQSRQAREGRGLRERLVF